MKDLIVALIAGAGGAFLLIKSLHLFVRWKASKLVGREVTEFGRNAVVYFYSPGCKACIKMEPVMKSVSRKTHVRKIDISNSEGLRTARKLGIWSTPTTVVIRDGRVKSVLVGYKSEEKILREVSG